MFNFDAMYYFWYNVYDRMVLENKEEKFLCKKVNYLGQILGKLL